MLSSSSVTSVVGLRPISVSSAASGYSEPANSPSQRTSTARPGFAPSSSCTLDLPPIPSGRLVALPGPLAPHPPALVVVAPDRLHDLVHVVRHPEELELRRRDHPLAERLLAHPAQEPVPEIPPVEDDGEVVDLLGLLERQRLEDLVERAEAAGQAHEAAGVLHEHDLAHEEVVEGDHGVGVAVAGLGVSGQLDIEADRTARAAARALVRGFHEPGAAARDHREPGAREGLADAHGGGVVAMPGGRPRAPEDRDRGPHGPQALEALDELADDLEDGPGVLGAPVDHALRIGASRARLNGPAGASGALAGLEERVESPARLRLLVARTGAARPARCEVVAAVGALAVVDALRGGLAAFVVGRGIVVGAVPADVQVSAAARAGVAEADPLARAQLDGRSTAEAAHGPEPARERREWQGREGGRAAARGRAREPFAAGPLGPGGSPGCASGCGAGFQLEGEASDSADVQECDRPGPIFSRLVDDPAFGEAVDEFVVGVAERVDHLQDADSKGDLAELRRLSAQLGVDARTAGFDLLADVAGAVESACLDRAYKPAHDGVVALTELARRIRLGHRGAMS